MDTDAVLLEIHGPIAKVILNRPDQLNSLDVALQQALLGRLEELERNTALRALILMAQGRAFSAGGDLAQLLAERNDGLSPADGAAKMMRELSNPLIRALKEIPLATICAVQGAAAGAGASLALSCDVVIAADDAFFLAPFLPKLGLIPDLGMTWLLARGLTRARAMGLMLMGHKLTAAEAAQWGLIWSCVARADLEQRAMEMAQEMAASPACAPIEARRALESAYAHNLVDQMEYETDRQQHLLATADFKEGAQAFLQRRKPVFSERTPPKTAT